MNAFNDILTQQQLVALSSIVYVGDETYREVVNAQDSIYRHSYLRDIKGRVRTKLVQMQCEIESRDPKFPFEFVQRKFKYGHIIPELRTKDVIIHIARSESPQELPPASGYKIRFSNKNYTLRRQLIIDLDEFPPYTEEPYYAILCFGGKSKTFSELQFPEPGYSGIAERILIPQEFTWNEENEKKNTFERKKVALKTEFTELLAAHGFEDVVV